MLADVALISVIANAILVFVQCMILLKIFETNVDKKYLKLTMLTGWMSSTILVLINSCMIYFTDSLFRFLGMALPPPMLFSTMQSVFSTIIGILIYQNNKIWKQNDGLRKN